MLQTRFKWRSGRSFFILICSSPRFKVRRPNRLNNIKRGTGHCITQIHNRPCSVHHFLPCTRAGFLWTVHVGLKDITLHNCFHKHNVAVIILLVAIQRKMCLCSTKCVCGAQNVSVRHKMCLCSTKCVCAAQNVSVGIKCVCAAQNVSVQHKIKITCLCCLWTFI